MPADAAAPLIEDTGDMEVGVPGRWPDRTVSNVHAMEAYTLPIFRLGHIPVLGEWFALPLVKLAGSKQIGDEAFNEIFHPIAERLLEKCDAVLRVGGASQGADLMVAVAQKHNLKVFCSLEEISAVEARSYN